MIQSILHRYDLKADTARGQHFLDDTTVIDMMVEEAELDGTETVLEIGAGLGVITAQLADVADTVIAYENDPRLIEPLTGELAGHDNVDIREEDALAADIPDFDVCVSNVPFHRSSDIIEFLGTRERRSVLLVQQEFADRLVAEPGDSDYSRITVRARYHFIPVYLETVPGSAFFPAAEVDGALVKLFPRNESFDVDEEFFFDVVRALFTHRRKKVRNAFYDSRHMFDLDKAGSKAIRDDLPHSEERVTNCDLRMLVDIAAWLEER